MSQPLRILVIDDNPDDRLLVIRELSRAFPETEFEEIIDAETFNNTLSPGLFNLTILDYQLRWSDGLKILNILKTRYPEIPVVMFTNSGSEEVAVAAMKAGLDDYVIKSAKHLFRLSTAVRLVLERTEAKRVAQFLERERAAAEAERLQLLEQLALERSRLEAVLQQMPAGVIIADAPTGKLLLGNHQVEKIWRQPFVESEDIDKYGEYKGFYQNELPYQPQEWPLARSLTTGEVVTNEEIEILRGDGTRGTVSVSSAPIRDGSGNIVAGVVTFFDITDRKQAQEALRQSEAKFRRLVDSNIIGVIFADMSGKINDANDAFLQIVGFTREDLHSGKLSWREMTPPEYFPLDEQAIAEIMASGTCTPFEKELMRADGSRVPVLLGIAQLEGNSDNCACFVLDLTERKQLEQSLRQQTEQLTQANRLKDDFLAVVSHELRTPLNAMLGWVQLLRSRKLDEEKMNIALETIERNAKLQLQLVEDLLDISRLIRGKIRLFMRPLDPASAIEAAIHTVRPTAQAKGVKLETALAPNIGLISADGERLQQIMWNLLSNAIKFTPAGGTVEVRLTSSPEFTVLSSELNSSQCSSSNTLHPAETLAGDNGKNPPTQESSSALTTSALSTQHSALIQVIDTGIGINPEFLPYVFDRFRQAENANKRTNGGLGLGLAIVRQLVEMHGGTVSVYSAGEGQGATFTVKLPLLEVSGEQSQAEGCSA